MNYNFLTLGIDCSTATVLRILNYRKYALPFDWVLSKPSSIEKCLKEKFEYFHKNLYINNFNKRVTDTYGFEFPHDYPNEMETFINIEDCDDIEILLDSNEKYKRRVNRFLELLANPLPIIVLYRGYLYDVQVYKNIFKEIYNKNNVYFIVATTEQTDYPYIRVCNPDINTYNEPSIWNDSITKTIDTLINFY